MITIVQFLVACVAALVDKVFFMDLRCDSQPQPKALLQPSRSAPLDARQRHAAKGF